jgi:hypothetical protein
VSHPRVARCDDTRTRTHARTHTHAHTRTHAQPHTDAHTQPHARTQTHTGTRAHTRTLTHAHTHARARGRGTSSDSDIPLNSTKCFVETQHSVFAVRYCLLFRTVCNFELEPGCAEQRCCRRRLTSVRETEVSRRRPHVAAMFSLPFASVRMIELLVRYAN